MYKMKSEDGSNNLIGKNLKRIRESSKPRLSKNKLAERMQVLGFDVDRHVIRRIESGERFATDFDIKGLSMVLNVTYEQLIDG